jgi:Lar family restriction alleviation protein
MKELKPCPFCGGKAVHQVNLLARIRCSSCNAQTNGYLEHSTAIANWNKRQPSEGT